MSQRRFTADNEAMLVALGRALAAACSAGMAVYLHGVLGAGKTTLTRGIARGLGHRGAVKSPTYTLVEPYLDLRPPLYHLDLYRVGDPQELEFMGIRDYFTSEALTVVEWPERGRGFLPAPDRGITIAFSGAARQVTVASLSAAGGQGLAQCSPPRLEPGLREDP